MKYTYLPGAIIDNIILAQLSQGSDLEGLDVMVVGVDIDVIQVQLMHGINLLKHGRLLCEQGAVDGASGRLWDILRVGGCEVEEAVSGHNRVPGRGW